MLSKNKIKYIHSLELKKNRKAEHVFVAEGHKTVGDLLGHFPCKLLIATKEWFDKKLSFQADEIIEVNNDDLFKASFLKTPQEVLAVFEQPEYTTDATVVSQSLCLALDDVQDPGNLGTILRVADWFGIGNIFCDADCAGVYNPKCVQASMGAIFRVKTFYTDLPVLLNELKQEGLPVFGTFLDGKNIYTTALSTRGLIVMGNEGKGISAEIEALTGQKLTIPSFARNSESTESLNVGVATGIILSEFKRRM